MRQLKEQGGGLGGRSGATIRPPNGHRERLLISLSARGTEDNSAAALCRRAETAAKCRKSKRVVKKKGLHTQSAHDAQPQALLGVYAVLVRGYIVYVHGRASFRGVGCGHEAPLFLRFLIGLLSAAT